MVKTILVNWTFKPEYCTTAAQSNLGWTSNDNRFRFICTNKTDIREIEQIIYTCAPDGDLLVLLHKNPPHSTTLIDVDKMYHSLKDREGKLIIRLFGGGTELLYFGPKSDLGILGDRDKGLFATFYEIKEPQYKKVRSGFIINRDTKTVDSTNLEYIWRNYWESPKKVLYRLMEDFRLYTDGFNFEQNEVSFQEHLMSNPTLWYALHCFAGHPKEDTPTQIFQYGLSMFQEYLESGSYHHEILSNLQQLRKKVSDVLTGENISDHSSHLREIYTGMFQLFQQIPVHL